MPLDRPPIRIQARNQVLGCRELFGRRRSDRSQGVHCNPVDGGFGSARPPHVAAHLRHTRWRRGGILGGSAPARLASHNQRTAGASPRPAARQYARRSGHGQTGPAWAEGPSEESGWWTSSRSSSRFPRTAIARRTGRPVPWCSGRASTGTGHGRELGPPARGLGLPRGGGGRGRSAGPRLRLQPRHQADDRLRHATATCSTRGTGTRPMGSAIPTASPSPRTATLWCVDNGNSTVKKLTADGTLLLTLGVADNPRPRFSNRPFSVPCHVGDRPANRRVLRGRRVFECCRPQVLAGGPASLHVGRIGDRRGPVQHRPQRQGRPRGLGVRGRPGEPPASRSSRPTGSSRRSGSTSRARPASTSTRAASATSSTSASTSPASPAMTSPRTSARG